MVLAGFLVRQYQQSLRDQRAVEAREIGLQAAASGDWELAVAELSLAVSRIREDIDVLLVFANARSRVPMENGGHLGSALNLYVEAVQLCRDSEAPRETMIMAMEGRGRLEATLGQISRLRKSSLELLEIDRGNVQALEQLQAIQFSTGNLLPSQVEDVIRGDRTTEEWLEALRASGDESALRWVLEKISLGTDTAMSISMVLELMFAGKSSEIQQAQLGRVQESSLDLLEKWKTEGALSRTLADLFATRVMIRERRQDEALVLLNQIELGSEVTPTTLLLAADLHGAFSNQESRGQAAELLARASTAVVAQPDLMFEIAIRNWNSGRIQECFELLNTGIELIAEDKSAVINSLLLVTIRGGDLRQDWRGRLDEILQDPDLSPSDYERVLMLEKVWDLKESDEIKAEEVIRLCGNFGKWVSEPLVLCLLGDLASEAGLIGLSVDAYQNAVRVARGVSVPISQRLIRSLQQEKSYVGAFREAAKLVSFSNTVLGMLTLANAWVRLESTGISAADVVPNFGSDSSPRQLVLQIKEAIEGSGNDTEFLEPLMVRTMLLEVGRVEAQARLNEALASGVSVQIAGQLVGIATEKRLDISDSTIEYLESEVEYASLRDAISEAIALRLQGEGDFEGAVSLLQERLAGRTDQSANRLLGFALLQLATRDKKFASEGFARVLASPLKTSDIERLMRASIRFDDAEKAIRIVERVKSEFGLGSREMAIAGGLYAIAFLIEDEDEIVKAIGRIDPIVSSGSNSIVIDVILVRLLTEGPRSTINKTRAIEILMETVSQHPEHINSLLFLINLLQDDARLAEANEFITQAFRMRVAASASQQAQIASFLLKQGRSDEFASLICEIAELTGQTEDLFRCFQVQLELGSFVEADRLLDVLSAKPESMPEIATAIAERLRRRGNSEEAIESLRGSTAFASELDRQIAIATLLMEMENWEGAVAALRNTGEQLDRSGEGQLLLAISMLEEPIRDVAASKAALDRVVQFSGDKPGFLRRVASIAMADPDLRDDARAYIDLLGEVASDQAEVMRLADDLYRLPAGAVVPLAMQERGRQLTRQQNTPLLSWRLYLDVLSEALTRVRALGNLDEADRLASLLREESSEFLNRFPNNSIPLRRQSQILLLLGDPENAALSARGALNEILREQTLGDIQLLARAEFLAGHYDLVISALSPFRREIEEDPDSRPASWQLLFSSLLLDGQVEEARSLLTARILPEGSENRWIGWLATTEKASADVALQCARVAMEELIDASDKILVAGVLGSVFQKEKDERLFEMAENVLAEVGQEAVEETLRFQIMAARVELLASVDKKKATKEAQLGFAQIPPSIFSLLRRMGDLEGADRDIAEAYFSPVCIFLNNFIARAADLVIAGEGSASENASILVNCDEAELTLQKLLPNNLDVIDTRARLKLAQGKLQEALKLATIATKGSPGSAAFQLTRAEVLLALGNLRAAEDTARYALRLAEYEPSISKKILDQIEVVIEKCRSRVRLNPRNETEVLV